MNPPISSAEQAYQSGSQALQLKLFEPASIQFQHCYLLCKRNGQLGSKLAAKACVGLIKCYRARGQTENAIALCRQLAKSNNPKLKAWAHHTLAALGAAEDAPDSSLILYQTGVQAFKKQQYDQAIAAWQEFEQWCEQQPESRSPLQAKAQMGLVKCYQATEQPELAIALCQKLTTAPHPTLQLWARRTLSELENPQGHEVQPEALSTIKPSSTADASPSNTFTPNSNTETPKLAVASDSLSEPDRASSEPPALLPTPEEPQLLEAGLKANRRGNHAEAIELLTDYLRCQPSEGSRNFLQAQMTLIKAYLATEQVEIAIARCRELNGCNNMALKNWANKTLAELLPEAPAPEESGTETPTPDAQPEISLDQEPAESTSPIRRRVTGAFKSRKALPRRSPNPANNKFAKEEWVSLAGTFLAVLVLSLLASGSIAQQGIWGIFLLLLAMTKGASWAAPSSNIVRPAIGAILLAVYIISPLFTRLIIYAMGMLIGYLGFWSFQKACQRSNAVNLTDPQPLRMLIAIFAGIFLTVTPAFLGFNSVKTQLADLGNLEMIASATPLHQAVGQKDVAAVRSLLTSGSDANALDAYNQTPLHWAVSGCMTVISKSPGFEEDESFDWSCQPNEADLMITKILLESGGNPNPDADQFGDSLIDLAHERDDPEMVALLQQYGAQ